jgi:hypothetical protein
MRVPGLVLGHLWRSFSDGPSVELRRYRLDRVRLWKEPLDEAPEICVLGHESLLDGLERLHRRFGVDSATVILVVNSGCVSEVSEGGVVSAARRPARTRSPTGMLHGAFDFGPVCTAPG